jgi:hypothetical protein
LEAAELAGGVVVDIVGMGVAVDTLGAAVVGTAAEREAAGRTVAGEVAVAPYNVALAGNLVVEEAPCVESVMPFVDHRAL